MRTTISCIATAFIAAKFVTAQPGLQTLESVLHHSPFSKFGSSALEAFSGVSDNFAGLGIGTVFKRIAESSQISQESPENTAYKFLRYATPLFPTSTIEQFLASPLNMADSNSKLASFFEQTQSLAKTQFSPHLLGRQLQKQTEEFDTLYGVFSDVGKNSFLDGKSPENAATSFLSQLTSFPSTAVGTFLTIPSVMQNVPATSFFAQMRDSALQMNTNALNRRRLQFADIASSVTDPAAFASRITENIPFASQLNIKDIQAAFPQPLKAGIQQINAVNPLSNVGPFSAFENVISEVNPLNRISSVSQQDDLPTVADLVPNSKFLSYFRDATKRVSPESAERRLQGFFDLKSAQEKIAALTFENIANKAKLSSSLKANDAANMWLSSLSRVLPGDSVRSFLDNVDMASVMSTEGPFHAKMIQAAQDRFSAFFEH